MSNIVINFYGGPGTGKSTMAARIFSELKMKDYNCELITEYAKRKVWEQSYKTLENQVYVFAKQQFNMWTVSHYVDLMITDSPLILGNVYGGSNTLHQLVKETFESYTNINIFLHRTKKYNPYGRMQNESEAKEFDKVIKKLLDSYGYKYSEFEGNIEAVPAIINHILLRLGTL